MAAICYVDTSALAKRYVQESGSAAFDAFCEAPDCELIISPLVATELSALLQRRVRAGELTSRYVNEARRRFQDEVASGAWRLVPFQAAAFSRASELLWTLGAPLATLDSMHLACALLGGAESLATADRQLATACGKAMLHVHTFR